jgi:hypothetical protein
LSKWAKVLKEHLQHDNAGCTIFTHTLRIQQKSNCLSSTPGGCGVVANDDPPNAGGWNPRPNPDGDYAIFRISGFQSLSVYD